MGRSDLIGSAPHHLVPRHDPSPAALASERRRETPTPDQLAKKYGQNKPRPGGAIVRTPSRNATARPAGKVRKAITGALKNGRR
jgi:hypothetical protein